MTCTWGDICTLEYGKAFRDCTEEPSDENRFRVFGTNGPIGWGSMALADGPGVIVGRKGAYRGVHFWPDPFCVIDTAYYLRPKADQLDMRWAYYKLLTVDINRIDVGAAIPTTSRAAFYTVPVSVPPLATQRRIAAVLSAYDDLIENNRRRMALLEQAARLLYDEWFVRLRFPGHEHARITDGVPEGWERRPLASLCGTADGIQTGPFGSQLHQSDYSEDGVPVVMPKDLLDFRVAVEGVARIPEPLAQKLSRHRMVAGDTVYGRRGDIGRRAFVSRRQVGWLCGTGCLRIRPDPAAVSPRYLFDSLGAPETAGTIANRAKGATMPNLNTGVLKSVPVLVAPRHLQDRCAESAVSTADLIETLAEANQKLCAARDLLLPRLMSGEIEV